MKSLNEIVGGVAFMATNNCGYGLGDTWDVAVLNLRRATRRGPRCMVLLPLGSTVDGSCITYPKRARWRAWTIPLV